MSEFKKQKEFFTDVIELKKRKKDAIKVYQDLVFYRFYEVLSNANPIFTSLIDEKEFNKVISKYMKSGAKTDLIWQIPNEFRKFIKKDKSLFKDIKYVHDLLWFEWIEIELFMQNYKKFKFDKFDINKSFKISKSARLKKLSYKVYEREFETKGEYALLAYYDLEKEEVIYREISIFMYEFCKLISKKSIKKAIKELSKKYDLEINELKDVLTEPLKELCSLGILKQRIENV